MADIVRLVCEPVATHSNLPVVAQRAATMEVADDADAVNRLFREQRWTDGLPVVAPTTRRVELMLRCTQRARDEVIATIPPFFGTATVEHIEINAVMAGCDPEYLPVLIAAIEAVSAPEFNLQAVQTTTHPVSVFLIGNGPLVKRLGMNSGINCLGQGNWANATLGRALHLILQNIGGAIPGEMDLATQGQPGKYLFCCAENEQQNPWEPLHVERGLRPEQSAVTVIGAEGTQNINTHAKTADEVLHVFAETLARPSSNDYWYGGNPWLRFGPEHAAILKAGGLDKAEVKRRLWAQSKLPASTLTARDFDRMQTARHTELGAITRDTLVPICARPEDLGIIVAGGPGTHSVNIATFANTRSVTREVIWAG